MSEQGIAYPALEFAIINFGTSQSFETGSVLLDHIKDRPHGDTRQLKPSHVEELAESIAAVGLIHPLAIDQTGHLIAGGHRRAALLRLREMDPQLFTELFPQAMVPILICPIDSQKDVETAISIEAAENEKRKDYTPSEVRALAERLIQAGYRATRGKPSNGEKPLQPALAKIIGKSKRTVQRYLEQEQLPQPVQKRKNTTSVAINSLVQALRRFEQLSAEDVQGLMDAAELQSMASQLRSQLQREELD